jgi:hypothetical protein
MELMYQRGYLNNLLIFLSRVFAKKVKLYQV